MNFERCALWRAHQCPLTKQNATLLASQKQAPRDGLLRVNMTCGAVLGFVARMIDLVGRWSFVVSRYGPRVLVRP
jgi:hypothetical protein